MATFDSSVLALLKVFYKDKTENLLFRNSPVFSKIAKERIEGKSANFPALAGFSGGVGGSYKKALANASNIGAAAQWEVTPGQVFGVVSFTNKEAMASKTDKGAFLRVADAKMFTSFDAVKKVLATALYGRGYGEICYSGSSAAISSTASNTISGLPEYAMMTLVPGLKVDLKSSLTATAALATFTITAVNGESITFTSDKALATTAVATSDVLCIADSMKSGAPVLPMGLAGWLPQVAGRSGANWNTYVAKSFMGVNRSVNADALCGAYINSISTNETKLVTLKKLMRKLRRQGSKMDIIILNDADWDAISTSLETSNSYFTQTSSKAKKSLNAGTYEMTAAFSTNFIENIYDDAFCPEGRAYVLDSDTIKFWSYTNADKVMDTGVVGNEPGTKEVTSEGDADKPYQLNIDDLLTLQPGEADDDGACTVVGINVYGTYVVTNTAHNGVCNFYQATDIQAQATA